MIKLSVSETEWSSLLARTGALILYISIWIFVFGPEKLPGLSRNGPQVSIHLMDRDINKRSQLLISNNAINPKGQIYALLVGEFYSWWIHEKNVFFSQWHRWLGRQNPILLLPTVVEPMTFWLLVQMLHQWATGETWRAKDRWVRSFPHSRCGKKADSHSLFKLFYWVNVIEEGWLT